MRELLLHVDKVSYEVTKPTKMAENIPDSMKKGEMEECLFVRAAIEKQDEENPDSMVSKAVRDIIDVCGQIKTKKVMLYPYVHLLYGSKPGSASVSLKILKDMQKSLKSKGYVVKRAPFGFYKKFTVSCKGHPLSELSREIAPGGEEIEVKEKKEKAPKGMHADEDGVIKELLVILPDGKVLKQKELDTKKYPGIDKIIKSELGEEEKFFEKPPHLKYMRTLEIAEPEPSVSDAGNLRYFPKGYFMVELLRDLCWKIFVRDLGGYPVQTPIVINPNEKSVSWMMSQFPERLYKVLPGRKEKAQDFILRPASDYGIFSMFRDTNISYRNLPFGLYEYDYGWRYEQRGELLGMYRIRSFMMPDIHTLCADMKQAFDEFERQTEKFAIQIYRELGFEPEAVVLNCKSDFFNKNKEVFRKWARNFRKPIVVKLFTVMKTYKVAWVDVVAFDNLGRPMEMDTVQMDTESAKHWNITYKDKDNKDKYPIILHTGVGIERMIASLLENAGAQEVKKKNPTLPLWISPVQVRICPVSDKFLKLSEKTAEQLTSESIRVDVDDRVESVSKKVRDAEMEWVPFIVVIGQREKDSGKLAVRLRNTGEVKPMSPKEIVKHVKKETEGFPYKSLPMPRHLSRRPVFVG